jgi:CcmD family protein
VAAAYAVTWVVLIGYTTYVNRRLRRVRQQDEGSL